MRRVAPLLCVLALAACGGASTQPPVKPKQPRLPHALAQSWAQQADAVAAALAAGDGCGAQQLATSLQSQVIAAVNAGQVSRRFLEPLTSGANAVASQIVCVPPPEHHDNGKHKGEKKHKHGEGD